MSTWPPSEGLSTVVVPRKEAILVSSASIRIKAPASLVFDIVRNAGDYSKWNSWIPQVTIRSQAEDDAGNLQMFNLGTSFTYHVIMDSSKSTKVTDVSLKVTDISIPEKPTHYVPEEILLDGSFTTDLQKVYRISWTTEGGLVSMGLRTERFHEIIVIDENECEVRTWENQGNFLARTVKWMYQKILQEKFEAWVVELKKYSEEKAQAAA
jgi:hypothetical protein